jgi:hypothetical protein
LCQLLKWNLDTDEVEAGQWLKGRVFERRCDLSPSGALFAYFARAGKAPGDWSKWTYTAVSRPPFFTALALWFKGDSYGGGALFENDRSLLLNEGGIAHAPKEDQPKKLPIKVGPLPVPMGEDWPIEHARRIRDGWRVIQNLKASHNWSEGYVTSRPLILERQFGDLVLRETTSIQRYKEIRLFEVEGIPDSPDLTGADLAEWDLRRNRLLFARAGSLWSWRPSMEVQLITDLGPNKFEPVEPAEWAQTWP